MTYEEKQKLIEKISKLEWTEEIRPGHPWYQEILVNRRQVAEAIESMEDS